jgi:hypothetical protein
MEQTTEEIALNSLLERVEKLRRQLFAAELLERQFYGLPLKHVAVRLWTSAPLTCQGNLTNIY